MMLTQDTNCLSDQQLAQYIEGNVCAVERRDFEKHLSACDSCLKVVIGAKKSLKRPAEDIVPEGVTERLISLLTISLRKNHISELWVKMKEGVWQLGKEIEIVFGVVENAFSLFFPPGIIKVNLASMSVRGDEKAILRSFEIPLPKDKIRLSVTLYMVADNEIELSMQVVAGTEIQENITISLCEESGRILKSETLKPDSSVCFPLYSLNYIVSVEYKEKIFRIPLRQKKI